MFDLGFLIVIVINFTEIKKKEEIKIEKEEIDYVLRSLWTIPAEWIIFIPDEISFAHLKIKSLPIFDVFLIYWYKSWSYNYCFFLKIKKNRK